MKCTPIILALLSLIACNSETDKKAVDEKQSAAHIDGNKVNGQGKRHIKEVHNCDFENFIADSTTPILAKNIYLDNNWNLSDINESLALLDSLRANDKQARPFYFKVVTKTSKRSDGYFSEGLGLAGKEFVEDNTKEFAVYFDNKECFTTGDLETWADIVMLEFSLIADNEFHKLLIDDYINKLVTNTKECSTSQKETIRKFSLLLRERWNEILKHLE